MKSDPDCLILEYLRHIRDQVDRIASDLAELKHRMSMLEHATPTVLRHDPARSDRSDL